MYCWVGWKKKKATDTVTSVFFPFWLYFLKTEEFRQYWCDSSRGTGKMQSLVNLGGIPKTCFGDSLQMVTQALLESLCESVPRWDARYRVGFSTTLTLLRSLDQRQTIYGWSEQLHEQPFVYASPTEQLVYSSRNHAVSETVDWFCLTSVMKV